MVFDVVIAGGGPNGLMLAAELALAGVRPVVLEPRTGPSAEQRANGMTGQVLPLLDRRGMFEQVTGQPGPPVPMPRFMFAAFPLSFAVLAGNPVHAVLVPQRRIEEGLLARAAGLGVEIRAGRAMTGFEQRDDRVVVTVDEGEPIEARYLVGADGGRSLTRKLAGIGFPGVTSDHTVWRAAHVRVPDSFVDPVAGGLAVPGYGVIPKHLHHRTDRGLVSWAPDLDGRQMISVATRDRPVPDTPFDLAELRATLAYVLGADVPVGPPAGDGPRLLRRSAGHHTRIADRYRDRRVLLVGDAAHVHSAMGGPGLNLGLQDAVNLGWKLAATIRGWAPAGLLDTYGTERRPAAERVALHTQAQSVLVGPGPEVTALRTVFAELLEDPDTLRRIAALISGADVRYDMGPVPDSPLTGYFVPDLGAVTRSGRPLLVDNTGTLAGVAEPWGDRVDVVRAPLAGAAAMLVRPDCYVAWAATTPDAPSLRAALERWFGSAGPGL